MSGATSVIVEVEAGGRGLLRTADTIARQHRRAADVFLIKSPRYPGAPLVESVAARLQATVIDPRERPGVAVNAAARRSGGEYLLVLPAGLALHDSCVGRCESMFRDDRSLAAIAPVVALRTPDGLGELRFIPQGLGVSAVFSDTRSVPPAFVVRRAAWESIGGFDDALDGLVHYEFWLRMALAGQRMATLQEPLMVAEIVQHPPAEATDSRHHQPLFRAVIERHAAALERDMTDVLVTREIRFGELREVHSALTARRDADLAELDELRAEAAHHLAYLAHHGRTDVDWGDLRRVDPVSRDWGYDRGQPVDRRYIDDFLTMHSSDVRGAVLEVQEDDFTRACGGPRVTGSSILDIDAANRRATVLADLRSAPEMPSNQFDCIVLTQTLHVIDDVAGALRECHRMLKPGGVLLATVPAASRVCLEYGEEGDFWRATPAGVRALFRAAFSPSQTSTTVFGNVLTNTAFLHGFASSELTEAEFAARDPYFPALTGIRARKTEAVSRARSRGVVLLYHRVDGHDDVHQLGIPPALFAEHLQWLEAECTVMPLDELLAAPPEALPPRAVALTFDDGYLDNLQVAAPLLQQRGMPAAFFLTTRWIEEPGEYWWDLLERILLGPVPVPSSLKVEIGGRSETVPTSDAADRLRAHWRLHEALVHASPDERDRLEASLRAWSDSVPPRVRPMTADEIRRLAALPGMAIGAHTVNHLSLPDQSPEVRMMEVTQSRAELARVVGRPVDLFAYPYGATDRESAAAIRRSCRWGMSCEEVALADAFDAARVPRLDVKRWEIAELAARIDRLFQPVWPAAPRAFTLGP